MISRYGLVELSSFKRVHPIVVFIYYCIMLSTTMLSMSPIFLSISFGGAFLYLIILKGTKIIKNTILMVLTILILMTTINTFFTHNGETVLFYINGNRITLEAFYYGISSSFLIATIIIWFNGFNLIMTSDKIIYLFGKILPIFGLIVSMIFRFVPLLHNRFHEIEMGQICMGMKVKKSLLYKIRQLMKEVSILIAWSLEASIETADSMGARGYGLPKRSSFHLFKLMVRDKIIIIFVFFIGGISLFGCLRGYTSTTFYPKIMNILPEFEEIKYLVAFTLLAITPILIESIGGYKWKK